eukprot:CAMPEP_0117756456 /NCGR_PEP_ID=MMETSP0947-20121206/14092_1 /TAXON_ID=44440 /ORGANISM="Chattonella subsalsa, Strain CCMP2191" /LENGTH=59 /DNA_ID=CAMNT_0005576053 /DNA_START=475 /DNA_END=654 /DNA_ORIENTATION=+
MKTKSEEESSCTREWMNLAQLLLRNMSMSLRFIDTAPQVVVMNRKEMKMKRREVSRPRR